MRHLYRLAAHRFAVHRFAAYWAAPVVMISLALLYSWLVFANGYGLWKGPNFGMFATIDGPQSRLAKCYVLGDDDEHLIRCPSNLDDALLNLYRVPSEARLERAAQAFYIVVRDNPQLQAESVRLELWHFEYLRDDKNIVFRKEAEEVVTGGVDE